MGFTITEGVLVVSLGLTIPNIYVTLRGGYTLCKNQQALPFNTQTQFPSDSPPYMLSGRMVFYSSPTDTANLRPLHEENINLPLQQYPVSDPIQLLYNKAKSMFPNYTLVDDL